MVNRFLMSAGLALALVACGGGDSGGSPPPTGGGGGPTPTPTPTPTPSPTPTPTYQTFAQLTGTQTFGTTCGGTVTDSPPTRAVGGMPLGQGLRIVSDRSQPSYEISSNGNIVGTFTSTFTQAERDTTRTGEAYVKVLPSGFTERLSIITPSQNGTSLEYVRVAQIIAQPFVGSTNLLCAFGIPTIVTDRPAATVTYAGLAFFGTATVTLNFGSGASTNYVVSSSVITMTANPANGQVNFSLDLKGREISAAGTSTTVTDLGVFTGTATLDGTTPSFTDILVNSSNTVSGTFGGGFFGPQGGTAAVSASIQTRRADNSDLRLGALFILRPQS
ncbi:hypothetical protein [Erythrobacter sp. BLCC-B19]|uniref:hypothetical protein n=1 Tax=Erythrobacter sp. BLCC-B19 TaxID=3025315 RepID=UPI002362BEAC|nr:hypothetical protein [Erythrobacter sp. BLCC-B19]WDA40908.1 hypothetical protein PS060_15320 [Erythrobacter sp. BLCC-B19]